MNLNKGLTDLIQTIASASVFVPFEKKNNLATLDNASETRQLRSHREARLHQTRERMASLKQFDSSQLPLVAINRSAFERALLESTSTAGQSMSDVNTNRSSSKKATSRAIEIRLEPWAMKTFAPEIRLHEEIL